MSRKLAAAIAAGALSAGLLLGAVGSAVADHRTGSVGMMGSDAVIRCNAAHMGSHMTTAQMTRMMGGNVDGMMDGSPGGMMGTGMGAGQHSQHHARP